MNGFKHKKRYGQNFIKDKNVVKNIVKEANIDDDSLVIEVGVGKGILTEEISCYAKWVISYEIDITLKDFLDEKFQDKNNVNIIYDDFLSRDIKSDIEKYDYKKIYFIANVPYYITTPILEKIVNLNDLVTKIVVMVQKEVGERLCASCGSRIYSSISVYLDYFYDRKIVMSVSKEKFIPMPKVDSVVVSLTRKDQLLSVKDKEMFFQIVRDSFQYKRKNIKNNLKKYDINKIEKVLLEYNYNLNSRAEELSTDVFVCISNELVN